MPWTANFFFIFRGILPTFLGDFIFKLMGGLDDMDTFKGRGPNQPILAPM